MKKIRYNSFVFAFLSIQIIYFAFDPNTNLVLVTSPVVFTVYCMPCPAYFTDRIWGPTQWVPAYIFAGKAADT